MGKKEKISKNISTLIKKYRKKAKFNQNSAADALHVSRQTISAYECESVAVPMSSLISIAMLYEIPLNELLLALCNNEEEKKYVTDNFPNANDPIRNMLLKYFQNTKISYNDVVFLSENDDDGQALRIAVNFQRAVVKKANKDNKKT